MEGGRRLDGGWRVSASLRKPSFAQRAVGDFCVVMIFLSFSQYLIVNATQSLCYFHRSVHFLISSLFSPLPAFVVHCFPVVYPFN